MSDNNPYTTPQSDVIIPSTEHTGGSVEKALAGEVRLEIGKIFDEAWSKTNGFKLTYFIAILIYIGIAGGMAVVFHFIKVESFAFTAVEQLITALVTYPLAAGLIMLGVKRAASLPTEPTMVLEFYHKIFPLFILYVLSTIFIIVGFILLIIPGIYLAVAYGLALPLVVEKKMGVWAAMETSRKAITKCFFEFFGLMLLLLIIIIVSMIPLFIGLFWSIPFAALCMGIAYRNLFGVNE